MMRAAMAKTPRPESRITATAERPGGLASATMGSVSIGSPVPLAGPEAPNPGGVAALFRRAPPPAPVLAAVEEEPSARVVAALTQPIERLGEQIARRQHQRMERALEVRAGIGPGEREAVAVPARL